MEKRETDVYATLSATVSYLVSAQSINRAVETANFHLNESSIQLAQLKLLDEQGMKKSFKVERVNTIEWIDAKLSDYSNRFQVVGRVRLTLCMKDSIKEQKESFPMEVSYQLPRSIVHDGITWVIPTRHEPVFIRVLNHKVEWNSLGKETAIYHKASSL